MRYEQYSFAGRRGRNIEKKENPHPLKIGVSLKWEGNPGLGLLKQF